jgi:hypothetical protein
MTLTPLLPGEGEAPLSRRTFSGLTSTADNLDLRAYEIKDCFCTRPFANLPFHMRLLVEIVIVAALIYLGWNTPFKDWAAQGGAMATSKIHAPAWEDNSSRPTPATKRNPR